MVDRERGGEVCSSQNEHAFDQQDHGFAFAELCGGSYSDLCGDRGTIVLPAPSPKIARGARLPHDSSGKGFSRMHDIAYKSDMSIDERVLMAIVRVAERFKKNSGAIVNKWGLTFPQYNLLRVLDASENGENTMKNVNRIMLVSSANMTGIAKRLEKNGFIIRTNCPHDDRSKQMKITPAGTQVLEAIADHKERSIQQYLVKFSDSEKADLLNTLRAILDQTKGGRRAK